jgi:hypothetical protein
MNLFKPETYVRRNGRTYQTDSRGVETRVSPGRPWRGKSERRQVIKARHQGKLA